MLLPGGSGRKRRTAKERSAKAAKWWLNLFAKMMKMEMKMKMMMVKPTSQTDCREYCCIQ